MKSKIDPETIKIPVPGAVLEPSGDPWVVLGFGGASSISGAMWWSFVLIKSLRAVRRAGTVRCQAMNKQMDGKMKKGAVEKDCDDARGKRALTF